MLRHYIGIGSAGIAIVDKMSRLFRNDYTTEKTLLIDTEKSLSAYADTSCRTFKLTEERSAENYEEQMLRSTETLREALPEHKTVQVILSCGKVSAVFSGLLLELRKRSNSVEVVYIRPNEQFLAPEKKELNRLFFNSLAGLAKNSVIQNMFIFDNSKLQAASQNQTFRDYFGIINYYICYLLHMNSGLDILKPIFTNYDTMFDDINMFHTFALVQTSPPTEIALAELTDITTKRYFFDIPTPLLSNSTFSPDGINFLLTTLAGRAITTVATMFDVFEQHVPTPEKTDVKTTYNAVATAQSQVFAACKISSSKLQML